MPLSFEKQANKQTKTDRDREVKKLKSRTRKFGVC